MRVRLARSAADEVCIPAITDTPYPTTPHTIAPASTYHVHASGV
jgi:hypothetical protein